MSESNCINLVWLHLSEYIVHPYSNNVMWWGDWVTRRSLILQFLKVERKGKLWSSTQGSHLFASSLSSISGQRELTDSTDDITPGPPLTAVYSPSNLSKMCPLHYPNHTVDIPLSINGSAIRTRHTLSVHNTFIRGRGAQINRSGLQIAEWLLSTKVTFS